MTNGTATQRGFFISCAHSDDAIAHRIDEILRGARHQVTLQGDKLGHPIFMARLRTGLGEGATLLCLVSRDYQHSQRCRDAYEAALNQDPGNRKGSIVVFRIDKQVLPIAQLDHLPFTDLFPLLEREHELAGAVRGALGLPGDAADTRIAQLYRRPPEHIIHPNIRPVPGFVGRDAELDAIDTALWLRNGRAALINDAANHRLAGLGKSALASEYAWRNRDRYRGIWWIRAHSHASTHFDLIELGALLVRDLDPWRDSGRALEQTLGRVALGHSSNPWLLVYDDLDHVHDFSKLSPIAGAHLLVTARSNPRLFQFDPISVSTFHPSEAAEYLKDVSDAETPEAARQLAADFGCLPLALTIARASLRRLKWRSARYREAVHNLAGNTRPQPLVHAAITLAIDEGIALPESKELLALLAFPAPDQIPLEIIPAAVMQAAQREQALAELDDLSLITLDARDPSSPNVSVHRLVQEATRVHLRSTSQYESVAALATTLLGNALRRPAEEDPRPSLRAKLIPHALALLPYAQETSDIADETSSLLNHTAVALISQALYREAEPLLRREIAIDEGRLGDHPHVAGGLTNLAWLLQTTRRFDEAESLYRRILAIYEAHPDSSDTDVARVFASLAEIYRATDRLGDAEPLYRRALHIYERSFGPNHPATVLPRKILAELLQSTHRFAEAEPLLLRALAIDENRLGPQHPDVATSLTRLALLFQATNRLADAEPLLRRALNLDEKAIGPQHPDIASDLTNLATLLQTTHRLGEAEQLMRRALIINEERFGSDHPQTSASRVQLEQIQAQRLVQPLTIDTLISTAPSQRPIPDRSMDARAHAPAMRASRSLSLLLLLTFAAAAALPLFSRSLRDAMSQLLALLGMKLNAMWFFRLLGAGEPPAIDHVQCSVFSPPSAPPAATVLVQVFVHLPDHAQRANFMAAMMDPGTAPKGVQTLQVPIRRGAALTVSLAANELAIDEPQQIIIWRGEPLFCQFLVTLPDHCDGKSFHPIVRIGVDGGLVGRIAFTLLADSKAATHSAPAGHNARRYEHAFLSYASSDRKEVLKRAQVLSAAGVSFFQDVLSLDPGARWERELYRNIDNCDLFLLFWSQAAKDSEWVLKEAEYALARQGRDNLPDIVPVILETPPPMPPPPSLAAIHFNDRIHYLIATS